VPADSNRRTRRRLSASSGRLAAWQRDCFFLSSESQEERLRGLLFSGVVKKRAEARRGQGQGWGGLVMECASFSLGRQAPARKRTLIPSTLLRGTPRAESLRSFYFSLFNAFCVVWSRTTYLAPTRQPSDVPFARALALQCSIWVEEVRGAKFLREVH